MSIFSNGLFTPQFALSLVKQLSKTAINNIKGDTSESKLLLGTILGIIVAYPSVKIARAMSLFTGGIILAVAAHNRCDCHLDLSILNKIDFGHFIERIKRNRSLSVGLAAGYLIAFAFV